MQALDKLEKLINVDGCAEVISQVDGPPKPVARRNAKYVFTIKIVEAEDLKACDPNGTSDPYVVLCDEYQKRLAKTRIIMRNLNPRWDESVDITVQGPQGGGAAGGGGGAGGGRGGGGRAARGRDPGLF